MRRPSPFFIFLVSGWMLSGCPLVGGDTTPTGSVTQREKDVSGKLALALGGVAEDQDLLVVDESPKLLEFSTDGEDLFTLSIPEGLDSYTSARAARVTPKAVGIGYVTPLVDTRERAPVQVTIPPQELIQILIGEARGQLVREATLDDAEQVKDSSVSVTGDAIGAVIRNRIQMINNTESPGLFEADSSRYEANPPASYYQAVIEAEDGVVFQFSPVNPADDTHLKYLAAARRSEFEDEEDLVAYDQALLTAADIFNEETEDPTNGAFGFYSPSQSEYEVLAEALATGTLQLPSGAGVSDARFPSLAPIQVLILSEVASATTRDNRPSFVFVRERDATDPAVTDLP